MALRIIRKGNSSLSNDHNTMINRDLPNQHPIESIQNLQETLDSKYDFPLDGIPLKDLSFEGVEKHELDSINNQLKDNINLIESDLSQLTNDTTIIKDFIDNYSSMNDGFVTIPNQFDKIELRLFEEFIALEGDVGFILTNNYIPGNNSLEVYVNGRLQKINDDYIEVDEYNVSFTYPLNDGDYVLFKANGIAKINSPIHEEIIYKGGAKTFNLSYAYNIGDNSLSVYHEGLRLNVGTDYEEVDNYTVKLLKTLSVEDLLVFRRETHMAANLTLDDGSHTTQETWKIRKTIELDEQRIIEFEKSYIPGSHVLQVFENGILLTEGQNEDYIEKSSNSIELNYLADAGDQIDIVCAAGMFQWFELFNVLKDQSVFEFKNHYNINTNDLLVYENGMMLFPGLDYTEVNPRTIEMIEPIDVGSKVIVYKRR